MEYIKWFNEISKKDVPIVGGKGANLGEMTNAGFPVPPGFVVTTAAYNYFVENTGIKEKIKEILNKSNLKDPVSLLKASEEIQNLFISKEIPEDLKKVIISAYKELSSKFGEFDTFVAVRSSATAEDLEDASFAGQQATFLNIKGSDELLDAVKRCWASLWTARAINYREHMGFNHDDVSLAVVIQKQIHSKKSGVMFTADPLTSDTSKIIIEGSWGLGESIVSGEVTPDKYVVDKKTLKIVDKKINEKTIMTVYDENLRKTVKKEVPLHLRKEPCLNDKEVIELAKIGIKIEDHYKHPQDIEWAIDSTGIYIVQSRNITTLNKIKSEELKKELEEEDIEGEPILEGIPASPGIAAGNVRLILSKEDFGKFKEGEVLVTKMTNPDMEPLMAKASAIVTDEGGLTSHAAIISRELGVPCVVGTKRATSILKDGEEITVDAIRGKIYKGKIIKKAEYEKKKGDLQISKEILEYLYQPTATKLMLIAAHKNTVEKYKDVIDGIGLLRLEFLVAQTGKHPMWYIKNQKDEEFIETIYKKLKEILSIIPDKPVIIRTLDIRTDEYRKLEGGEEDPNESNPMMGWHGIRRDLDVPEMFKMQIKVFKKLVDDGFKNIWIMIPFVISPEEVKKAKKLMEEVGLIPHKDVKVGIMVETPAAALIIEDILKEKIDFISFGTNDLTQLTLGVDRNNELIQKLFNEKHPAVLKLLKRVIKICKKHNVYTSICGQAGSDPEMAEFLVKAGIDAISVNPDAIIKVYRTISRTEKKIILDKIRKL